VEDIYALEAQIKEYLNRDFSEFDDQKKNFIKHISYAVLSYDKKNFTANYALGVLDILRENEPDAIMHFNRCLSHPKEALTPVVHLHLAKIFYEREDYESAYTNFSTALIYRKFELEDQVNSLSEKLRSGWMPGIISEDVEKRVFHIDNDIKNDLQRYLRKDFDKATEELFDQKDLETRLTDLEKKKDYLNACQAFHEYWIKYGQN
jgi:hypothetical protein